MNPTVRIRCLGTGDAFGSGGRLNSCYHICTAEHQLLLDCGCSSLIGLRRWDLDTAALDGIIISHLHGDHFGGIPFLLLEGKYVSQREKPLQLLGPAALEKQVDAALEALYPGALGEGPGFPLDYQILSSEQPKVLGEVQVSCARVKHGSNIDAYALRLEIGGRVICYTGDAEWSEELVPLVAGSDLLIAECFAFDQPTPSHLDYQTLLKRRADLDCKRLVLTHLGPQMLANRAAVEIEMLEDGDLLEL